MENNWRMIDAIMRLHRLRENKETPVTIRIELAHVIDMLLAIEAEDNNG